MKAMFASLSWANYRLWFAGALLSNIGAWMQRTAQDWIVLTELSDHNAIAVGITMALQFGPLLFIAPFAGVLVDRINGRKLLVITQTAQAVLAVGLGALVLSGLAQLWMVFVFAFLLGVVTAFDNPARQTFVGELVPAKSLPNAIALNSASFNSARLIGPAIAGVSVAALGAGWVFVINGATFAFVLLALWRLRTDELRVVAKAPRARGQIREGIRYIRGRSDLVVVLMMTFLVGTFGFNFPIFTSTMASIEFGTDADGFGFLLSALAVGSVAGALLSARRERPRVAVVVAAAGGFAVTILIAALVPSYATFAIALVFVGLFSLTFSTSANAFVQTSTAPIMRGRVMSIYMAIFAGTTFVGAPIVGGIADTLGPRWALGVAALSGFAALGIGIVWFVMRRRHAEDSGGPATDQPVGSKASAAPAVTTVAEAPVAEDEHAVVP
ncbi:MFS transporter [Naasia lichenicola]|uniref:MFS transporter n=1 Tax=Naasia lichenicola TaxID=2565933 RepID=A0A4S4FLF4_9MICO|nr:MFS transporter [Naasia lichenicola]THG30722.1 MFS transporter [Naasia lichenicola]THG31959.1 MFS transporter [Naasia lichenicola]